MSLKESVNDWDYVIVGAGSAGCALADEIIRSIPGVKLLILEAGPSDRRLSIRLQAMVHRAMGAHDWGYQSQPDPTRCGLTERWFRGRVLGGTSSINSSIFVRGAASDFDRWAAQLGKGGNTTWAASAVLPLFKELECSDQLGGYRGKSGPLQVRTVRNAHTTTDAFIASACAVGHSFNEDYNGGSQEGVAYAQLSQRRRGFRLSAADAFLRPHLRKANVRLLLNAEVQRIEFRERRATSVLYATGTTQARASGRHIILCCGSINSPKLLMLSGIGDPEELERHGIGVLVKLPGVGQNLRDHPLVVLKYRTRIETYNLTGGIAQKCRFAASFIARGSGPLGHIFESVAFLRSDAREAVPDIQLHFVPLAWGSNEAGEIGLAPYPGVSLYVNKSHSRSQGRIRLASARARDAPLIECRLFDDESDLETLVQGVKTAREIMAMNPVASLLAEELQPGVVASEPRKLRDYIRRSALIANHSVGTCQMGHGQQAVVGPDLKVHGTENLWIADASVMPQHISGNTSSTCMMVGKKLGKHLVSRNE